MCLSGSTCHIAEAWIVVVTHSMHDRRFHGPYPAKSAACNAADCLRRQHTEAEWTIDVLEPAR